MAFVTIRDLEHYQFFRVPTSIPAGCSSHPFPQPQTQPSSCYIADIHFIKSCRSENAGPLAFIRYVLHSFIFFQIRFTSLAYKQNIYTSI